MSDFKESPIMYALALSVVAFIIAQSVFFIVKSWKHGKELGIEKERLRRTVVSSILFTIAPAISILVTVIVLANALGIVLPWIRLTVIGNLAYETVAAQSAVEAMGGALSSPITDPKAFSTVTWAMTIGSVAPLILLPFFCKKLQKKIGGAINKDAASQKIGDIVSAAAFIGIIAAFIARAIAGTSADGNNAGVMSVSVLIVSIVAMLLLSLLCRRFKLEKFEPFAMPLSMFIGMGAAMLIDRFLPAAAGIMWR
ncbi:MAG: DUF5058 family protein [Clostridia bacterium]|nr:DUF5058 family protein [Clostridia bacterium]